MRAEQREDVRRREVELYSRSQACLWDVDHLDPASGAVGRRESSVGGHQNCVQRLGTLKTSTSTMCGAA